MDSELLRIVLFVLGVLLVFGIYLWDRFKRRGGGVRMDRNLHRQKVEFDIPDPDDVSAPRVVARRADETGESVAQDTGSGRDADHSGRDNTWSRMEANAEPEFNMELAFSAHDDSDYLSTSAELGDDVERLIVQINLVARHGMLKGPAIAKAMNQADLQQGAMSIFHCEDSGHPGQILFSAASMVEPGSFPEDMTGFESPGITFFTQLPGVRDGSAIYARMLSAAEHVAQQLDADLQDETHSALTRQTIDHTRDAIQAHSRRVKLARSRH